jgi:hypothetical protein
MERTADITKRLIISLEDIGDESDFSSSDTGIDNSVNVRKRNKDRTVSISCSLSVLM